MARAISAMSVDLWYAIRSLDVYAERSGVTCVWRDCDLYTANQMHGKQQEDQECRRLFRDMDSLRASPTCPAIPDLIEPRDLLQALAC